MLTGRPAETDLERWVVHAVPGRVRLRVPADRVSEALALVHRLTGRRGVEAARWVPAARSLTLYLSPGTTWSELAASAPPPVPATNPEDALTWVQDGSSTRSLAWTAISAAASLVGLGPAVEMLAHLAPRAFLIGPISAIEA